MPLREHVRVETTSFAPGELPLSARTLCVVSCLRIVTGAGIPLCLVGRVTAAFYNDRGLPVWSRRVLLCKIESFGHERDLVCHLAPTRIETKTSLLQRLPRVKKPLKSRKTSITNTSYTATNIAHLSHRYSHQQLIHHPLPPTLNPQYPTYLTPSNNRRIPSALPFGPSQPLAPVRSCPSPSSSGHWYTSFSPQERRWINTWQPS
ncbi:hypothetical protein ISF_06989 [Cordyceps fumosorosea ARSEF 2679]|uniref:Uncharacterized protein n=1 Tax=Cordyceps fumosorosea (strain ARSEF 2679) TaxID=1081104 RepID=A0A167QLI9_CORFA|nr:hypothetical protein ISF_06989 [Cordyceps fumosorosea ARSEF 2679]OAA57748.1 hypothetical protein ISF_06989 [Cordyceps fumosorosea ARSEF 2679]